MGCQLEALDGAHRELMGCYARVLDPAVRQETGEGAGPPGRVSPTSSLMGYFVRSHARRQLRELGAVYAQLQHSPAREGTAAEKERAWLRQAREDVTDFADTLSPPDWTWDVLLSVAPPSALLSGVLIVFGLQNPSLLVLLLLALSGATTALAVIIVETAFKAKRRLFGGFDSPWSIYETEDKLFVLLNRQKRREFPFDLALILLTSVAASVAMAAAVVRLLQGDDVEGRTEGVVLSGVLAAAALVVAARTVQRALRRSPS